MSADQLWAKIALNWCPETVRHRGRPRRRWQDGLDTFRQKWKEDARVREKWKEWSEDFDQDYDRKA